MPCNRVFYEPRLSYADLSSNTIERLVLNPKSSAIALEVSTLVVTVVKYISSRALFHTFITFIHKPLFLQENYFTALQVAQKSVDRIFTRDQELIKQLVDSTKLIPAILEEYQELVGILVSANYQDLSKTYPLLTTNLYVVSK